MSDVFLSYSSQDRSQVQTLARALESQGFSIWWDHHIPPGTTWDKVIETALNEAKCVIVVWTKASVDSDWVRNEAAEGRKRQNLIPVLFEPVDIPLAFRRVQTVSLTDWEGTEPHEGFTRLVQGIARMLGQPEKAAAVAALAPPKKRSIGIFWLLLPTIVVVTVAVASMSWRIPTSVHVELKTNRLTFTMSEGKGAQYLTDDLKPKWMTLQQFSSIRFGANMFSVADPSEYDFETDRFMEGAWHDLTGLEDMVTLVNRQSNDSEVTFESMEPTYPTIGTVDAVRVVPNTTLEMAVGDGQDASLAIRMTSPTTQLTFTPDDVMQLVLDHVTIAGAQLPAFAETEDSLSARTALRSNAPSFEIEGGDTGVLLILGFPVDREIKLFSTDTMLVRGLDFLEQGKNGNPVSPESLRGTISYDIQGDELKSFELSAPDYVSFDDEDVFEIKTMIFDGATQTMHLRFDGVAHTLKTGTATRQVDHRITVFDYFTGQPYLLALLGVVVWMVPTTFAGWRLLKGRTP
ncbi:MAG: hypothetical protein NPIRA05_09990 [Nitrospirales bacterium]|nr:MAG: hypothetical protein NPIRA05_09990 [Nitrospirales bacterium]